jgi:hypothetical protein
MLAKILFYFELICSYMKYLIEYYWNKYIKKYIISNKFRITKIHLMKNDQFIQDITGKFYRSNKIDWNQIMTYRVMKRVDKMNDEIDKNSYYLYIEYSYLGNNGSLLLHEKHNLTLPLYMGYTNETIKSNDKERVRIIETVLQYVKNGENGENNAEEVIIEEDVDAELGEFCGIRKNYHRDISNYQFFVEDFVHYLLYKKKIHHRRDQMKKIVLQVSDYMLTDYQFGITDVIQF